MHGTTSTSSLFFPGQNSDTLTGLTNGSPYTVSVTAVNAVGYGDASSPLVLTPATTPTAPKIISVAVSKKGATLTWKAPSSDGGSAITGYDVYVGLKAGKEATVPFNSVPVVGVTDVIALSKAKYFVIVKAMNAMGQSVASNEISFTTK